MQEKAYYYMEARNGVLVRVPASKLKEWQEAQNNLTQKEVDESIARLCKISNSHQDK
ncbi:MAG: hypothetical protein R3Y18_00005 [Bacillota bacterium]